MGKVIHTKDGRTLMKGPDGRWMSAGKATEKKPITNETREGWNAILNSKDGDKIRIQDFSSLNHKPTGTETEYTLHNGRWSSAGGHSFSNDITNKGFGSFEGIVPKITKVESEAPKKKKEDFVVDYDLQKHLNKNWDKEESKRKSRELADEAKGAEAKKKPFRRGHAINQKTSPAERRALAKKAEESKSLSFEKREGLGLNPSEYKLSNGDGISLKSLNPNEGNPTNIKKLKDIPGRTSRHTDEVIVKSNYGDKEYVVTREHYQDAKTGYHRAEVVDIRQHVADKAKAARNTENMLKEYQKAYQNQLSSSAEKRMKELEEQADKMGYEIKMTNYSAQAQKNSLASPQFELVKKTAAKKSVPKNQIEVSDSHYIYSSGKRPSGNGNWAFYIGDSEEPIFFSGKYSEAKKKAIAEAAKRGVKKITLGS